jgi:hypothetical protein
MTDTTIKVSLKELTAMQGKLVYVCKIFSNGIKVDVVQGPSLIGAQQAAKRVARELVQAAGPGSKMTGSIYAARIVGEQLYMAREIAGGFNVAYVAK